MGESSLHVPQEECPGTANWNIDDWDVDELIGKSFLFWEAQESGTLREDHRVLWRGNSYMNDRIDRISLDGGWFHSAGMHALAVPSHARMQLPEQAPVALEVLVLPGLTGMQLKEMA
jgi:hypothetical protein